MAVCDRTLRRSGWSRTTRVGTYVDAGGLRDRRCQLLKEEVFGPILHVVRFQGGHLDK